MVNVNPNSLGTIDPKIINDCGQLPKDPNVLDQLVIVFCFTINIF